MERAHPPEVRFDAAPTRCPFCHESIALDEEAWVACEKCLARHHRACWSEGQRCATCGGVVPLSRGSVPTDDLIARLERGLVGQGFGLKLLKTAEERLPALAKKRSWIIERTVVLPYAVSASEQGLFRSNEPLGATRWFGSSLYAVHVSVADGRTTVALRADLIDRAIGCWGGFGGGLGGGLGGGGSAGAYMLAGVGGVVACLVGSALLAVVLSRLVLGAIVRNQERLVDGVLADLGPRERPAPPAKETL